MLVFYESDGTTPLSRVSLGTVPPGETYSARHNGVAYEVVLRNDGEETIEDIEVEILPVGGYTADQYTLIAEGSSQPPAGAAWHSPGDGPLSVPNLAADASATIWVDMSVPILAAPGSAQTLRLQVRGRRAD